MRPCALIALILPRSLNRSWIRPASLSSNSAKVASSPLLQQHGRDEEVYFEKRHPLGQIRQRDLERQSQVLLVEGAPELARQRLAEFPVNHLERNRKRVSGPHRARHEFQAVRELLFKCLHALFRFPHDVHKGCAETQQAQDPAKFVERRRKQKRKAVHPPTAALRAICISLVEVQRITGPLEQSFHALGQPQVHEHLLAPRSPRAARRS